MASLRINELPTVDYLNLTDRFFVSDVENGNAKTVTLDSLNKQLEFENLIGYDTYVTDINDLQEQISEFIGDFGDEDILSLRVLKDLIDANEVTETIHNSEVSTRIDNLNATVMNLMNAYSSQLANLQNALDSLEERNFQAGLATGTLYAQNVRVGEN